MHRNDATHRYEAHLDGTLAGYLVFREREHEITLIHTETVDGFQGRGVATELVRFALDDIRARGVKAVALCPFVRHFLTKHPEYADIVSHA